MRKGKKRALAGALAAGMMFLQAFPVHTDTLAATTKDAAFEAFMNEQGFPDSYKPVLRDLHAIHPNWRFEAFHTNLEWSEVVENEMLQTRNLIPHISEYNTGFYDTALPGSYDWVNDRWTIFSDPNWLQVSQEGLEYFLDPRNWITEKNIFMFEELAYNAEAQNIDGVKQIIKGTFMEDTNIVGAGVNPWLTSTKLTVSDAMITGIEPGTIAGQIKGRLAITKTAGVTYTLSVLDAAGKTMDTTQVVGTGCKVQLVGKDTAGKVVVRSTLPLLIFGDVNGDGEINSTDRALIKGAIHGSRVLNELEQKAADVNQDGEVNATDLASVKGHIHGSLVLDQVAKNSQMTYAEAFYEIGQELNVSPYLLAFRVRLEQGSQGDLAQISGNVPGYEGYYNYFNIGASGVTREEITKNAMTEAVNEGWNSRYKALYGGAKKLAAGHIWKGQDTLYLQKFDVEGEYYGYYWHQYMQNVLAPYQEGMSTYRTYASFDAMQCSYTFKIPVYLHMPAACPRPTSDGNPNKYLSSLSVAGYPLNTPFKYSTTTYSITVPKSVTVLSVSATPISSLAGVSGKGNISIAADTSEIKVVVTAQNGKKQTYHIQLIRT